MKQEKFSIRIESLEGKFIAYLSDKNRMSWSRNTAIKKGYDYAITNENYKRFNISVESSNYADIPVAIFVKV